MVCLLLSFVLGVGGVSCVILCNQHMKSCKCAKSVFETEVSDGAVTLSQVTFHVLFALHLKSVT